jgi:hypothetical protein
LPVSVTLEGFGWDRFSEVYSTTWDIEIHTYVESRLNRQPGGRGGGLVFSFR